MVQHYSKVYLSACVMFSTPTESHTKKCKIALCVFLALMFLITISFILSVKLQEMYCYASMLCVMFKTCVVHALHMCGWACSTGLLFSSGVSHNLKKKSPKSRFGFQLNEESFSECDSLLSCLQSAKKGTQVMFVSLSLHVYSYVCIQRWRHWPVYIFWC